MNPKQNEITFGPVTKAFKSMITDWFNMDHVKAFYYGQGLENTLANLELYCQGIKHNGKYAFDHWIALLNGEPFGFLMTSPIEGAYDPNDDYNKWFVKDKNTFTLDLLIGPKELLGQGIGTAMIQQFIVNNLMGADFFLIDPELSNTRATHVYQKVGFKQVDTLYPDYNPKPHLMMRLDVQQFISKCEAEEAEQPSVVHTTASAAHYDQEAKHYDEFNESRSTEINQIIENILRRHNVHSVLDLSCGTGSQVFWLAKRDFDIVGVDINATMLNIAQHKAKQQGLSLQFEQGDMRTSKLGQFDAALTIFNAIGHLTKQDFKVAMQNINTNLKPGGLYIFDIFNLDYLLYEDNITKLTIDWQKKSKDSIAREIQYSTISPSGILASYDIYHEQIGNVKPTITNAFQTLQTYDVQELEQLLTAKGFQLLQKLSEDGSSFDQYSTERLLVIAQKQKNDD